MSPRRRRSRRRNDYGPLIAGTLVLVGVVALVAAQLVGGGGTPSAIAQSPPQLDALVDNNSAQASVITRAAVSKSEATDSSDATVSTPTKTPPKEAPPLDAAPVTRLGSLSGNNNAASKSSVSDYPFSIVLVAEAGPGRDIAASAAAELARRGITARVAALSEAGRPDALVMLTASDGLPQSDAWYCTPGSDGSPLLAEALLTQLGDIEDQSATTDPPDPELACEDVASGRASTASALLRLPEAAAAEQIDLASAGVVNAVLAYFKTNAAAIRSARSTGLIWPASGPVTSHYGPDHPLGIDIGQWQGNILAATEGLVVWAGGDSCCSYGLYVIIAGPGGFETLYAHFNSLRVKTGDKVKQGQPLGEVGCTGKCNGTHLHFEVIKDGVRQDPMRFLP